jgi:hypothetical protein
MKNNFFFLVDLTFSIVRHLVFDTFTLKGIIQVLILYHFA